MVITLTTEWLKLRVTASSENFQVSSEFSQPKWLNHFGCRAKKKISSAKKMVEPFADIQPLVEKFG